MIDYADTAYMKLAIFYAGWLYFPAAAFLLWVIAKRSRRTCIVAALLLASLTVLAYARFIEPRILLTAEHDVALKQCFSEEGSVRLAVFSDTHNGLLPNAMPIRRIASRVRSLEPDAVFIAGDFVYFLQPDRFIETYAALGGVGAPVYAVLGNHDVGFPGPDVGDALATALLEIGVSMIDNASEPSVVHGQGIEIVGLSDTWQGKQKLSLIAEPSEAPRILLTHNPETIYDFPPGADVDLLLAGHTHGGQIRIPGLTCFLTPLACNVIRYGVKEFGSMTVFITSGTGMVGLPMRFLVPPRIDVLNVSWGECQAPA